MRCSQSLSESTTLGALTARVATVERTSILDLVGLTLTSSRCSFSDRLMEAYFNQVTRLYNVGARNFLFVSVPPVDRAPLVGGYM